MVTIFKRDIPGVKEKLDGSVRGKAYTFMEKLQRDHTSPGLHIEPITGSLDPRVRTGRVDKFWRAVLFEIPHKGRAPWFLYAGTFPHDDAIDLAKRLKLGANPVFGMAELSLASTDELAKQSESDWQSEPWAQPENWAPPTDEDGTADTSTETPAPDEPTQPKPKRSGPEYAVLAIRDIELDDLTSLGLNEQFAKQALEAQSDDEIVEICEDAPAAWQADALLELATGTPLEDVHAKITSWGEDTDASEDAAELLETEELPETPEEEEDQALREALMHPAARMEFNLIESDEDLRAAIEDDDFEKWRVFLHPEQRRYVMASRNGAFRLSGGAGTGKTVVLLHRAKRLADQDTDARIVLTTYNRTLADSLSDGLETLDPNLHRAKKLGEPGILVAGVDQLILETLTPSFSAFQRGTGPAGRALDLVLGVPQANIKGLTKNYRAWTQALEDVPDLPDHLRSVAFMQAEYALVILPRKIADFRAYARADRRGRKIPLTRRTRRLVWEVVEHYRAAARVNGTIDYAERAMLAAVLLDEKVREGIERPADHVLVDESQDLNPPQLHFLRSLVREGKNDLFLAEDAHQRIYAYPVTLSHHGIQITGRSRRLRLNYRTTAQNLTYALNLLTGGDLDTEDLVFEDLEGAQTKFEGLRSARNGPQPTVIACSSLTDEYDKAADTAHDWLEAGVKGSAIGVLCHSNRDASNVVGALIERGIPATHVHRHAGAPRKAKGQDSEVQVMTMHRAKGMEFERVLLFDLLEEPDRKSSSAQAAPDLSEAGEADRQRALEIERQERRTQHRSLIYVAASRARDEVVVLARPGSNM